MGTNGCLPDKMAVVISTSCMALQRNRSSSFRQALLDPCGRRGWDKERYYPQANAPALFHAICCTLEHEQSILVQISQCKDATTAFHLPALLNQLSPTTDWVAKATAANAVKNLIVAEERDRVQVHVQRKGLYVEGSRTLKCERLEKEKRRAK